MGPQVIIAVGIAYAYVALESMVKGNAPLAIVFAGYAFSNIGLWMAAR